MPSHKKVYLPYEEAMWVIRRRPEVTSRDSYERWWRKERPRYVPSQPSRHYAEWKGWPEFLGTENSFESTMRRVIDDKIDFMPYWEGVRLAQRIAMEHNITTEKEWLSWYDGALAKGLIPKELPKWPRQTYGDEWTGRGWKTWLGKNIKGKLSAAKNDVGVFAIHRVIGEAPNVITPAIHKSGFNSMLSKVNEGILGAPYKVFEWENEHADAVNNIINKHCSEQSDNVYIVSNLNGLLWDLSCVLAFHQSN